MMENKSELTESEKSFNFSFASVSSEIQNINTEPKKGFLWRGEEANPDDLIGSLKKIFETGFTSENEQSPLTKLSPIQSNSNFMGASNINRGDEKFTDFANEQLSAGMCGYIYLIDTSHNLQSIASCDENLDKPTFTTDDSAEKINEKSGYTLISEVNPQCIIGAMPSVLVAFALGLPEQSFITNPAYKKVFNCEKIKAAIGGEFLLIASECFDNPDVSVYKVHQRYSQTQKSIDQQTNRSTSSFQHHPNVVFFPNSAADNFFSEKTSKSPSP